MFCEKCFHFDKCLDLDLESDQQSHMWNVESEKDCDSFVPRDLVRQEKEK